MASSIMDEDKNTADRDEYSSYTLQSEYKSQTQATQAHRPEEAVQDTLKPTGRSLRAIAELLNKADESLPIQYQLMLLINNVKFTGNITSVAYEHHDFAARRSRQIARGGFFQTREINGIGVAKYPLFATASTQLSAKSYRALLTELRVLTHPPLAAHDNIVKTKKSTVGWTRLDTQDAAWLPMIFLELADLGSLTQYFSRDQMSISTKLEISQQIGCGLQALHSCGIVHGDLKADNILMFEGEDGRVTAKLSDFGCSYITSGNEGFYTRITINAGTQPWTTPEFGKDVTVSLLPNVDTYAFGMLVWRILLNGRSPFEGLEENEIEEKKTQDLLLFSANSSLEEEYDKELALRGDISSEQMLQLYMNGVSMPKRCFQHTLRLDIRERNLDKAMQSLSLDHIFGYGTATSKTTSDSNGLQRRPSDSLVSVQFLRLLDMPFSAKTAFLLSLEKVAENSSLPKEIRANSCVQLCYANLDSFGTAQNNQKVIQYLRSAASLGSSVAASIFRPVLLAINHQIEDTLRDELKDWLASAVRAGSFLARRQLRAITEDYAVVAENEEDTRLVLGSLLVGGEVATKDLVESYFHPRSLEGMRRALGGERLPGFGFGDSTSVFMSPFRNTYLHAGAALGVDADRFRNVLSVAATQYINSQDGNGNTPLHLALRFSNIEIAAALLESGAEASVRNANGETAWHWLTILEPSEIERLAPLMCMDTDGLGFSSETRNSFDDQYFIMHGGTPLHWAVEVKSLHAVSRLLEYGSDPLQKYKELSPLELSIYENAVDILNTILDYVSTKKLDFSPHDIVADKAPPKGSEIPEQELSASFSLVHLAVFYRQRHERIIRGGSEWLSNMKETIRILRRKGYVESWTRLLSRWHTLHESERDDLNNPVSFDSITSYSDDSSWVDVMKVLMETDSLQTNSDCDSTIHAAFWNKVIREVITVASPEAMHFAIFRVRKYSTSGRLFEAESLLRSYCSSLNADTTVVDSILRDCAEVDCCDENGLTPLMLAIRERNFEVATYLIHRGGDLYRRWKHEGTWFEIWDEYIANNADIDIIPLKFILDQIDPFKEKDPHSCFPSVPRKNILHMACRVGNPVIVEYLLSKFGTKDVLDRPDCSGYTAFHYAVSHGHFELVQKLCEAGVDINARAGSSDMENRTRSRPLDLCYVWKTESTEILHYKYGLERTREDILIGRLKIAEYLIRRKARRASRYLLYQPLPLKFAIGAAQEGMTKLLSAALSELRVARRRAYGISQGIEDYKLCLSNMLWRAAPLGHSDATKILIKQGGDVNITSIRGRSPLHLVAASGQAEMMHFLVKYGGADINAKDAKGETPGSYSLRSNDVATIRMVKSLGGYFTLSTDEVEILLQERGQDVSDALPNFEWRYEVSLPGEPGDCSSSEEGRDSI